MHTNMHRRKFLLGATVLGLGAVWVDVLAQPKPQVIQVAAKKFEYSPSQISLKLGVPVVLEFSSQDIVMGFNIPDLKMRTDIIPGIKTKLNFTPEKVGTFPFYCDIFCGDGHEDMSGMLIVT